MTRGWFVIAMLCLVPTLAHAVKVLEPLTFERGSAKLRADTEPILKAVADTLSKNPDILVIEVQGHASVDDASTDAKRLDLSDKRAAAVRDRLVVLGVASNRLKVQGYGSTKPIDTAPTALAASKNRRVEFLILERRP
jgi:outer membrane protein OmpA-like peptidoglycan-associated protein